MTFTSCLQPVVFYDHFYDFGIRDIITELIEARRRGGIHCRSPVKILHANNDGYMLPSKTKVGDKAADPTLKVETKRGWQNCIPTTKNAPQDCNLVNQKTTSTTEACLSCSKMEEEMWRKLVVALLRAVQAAARRRPKEEKGEEGDITTKSDVISYRIASSPASCRKIPTGADVASTVGAVQLNRASALQPREAETLAVREALSWLKTNYLDGVIVKTNAEVLITNLNMPNLSPILSVWF
nr:probable alpha-amylase 2 [Ipomoea batatas]